MREGESKNAEMREKIFDIRKLFSAKVFSNGEKCCIIEAVSILVYRKENLTWGKSLPFQIRKAG